MFEINGWSHYESDSVVVPWTTAILGSFIVGLSGLIPLLLLPNAKNASVVNSDKRNLTRQLSFAFGGLLGDVFLHLIPEAYGATSSNKGKI